MSKKNSNNEIKSIINIFSLKFTQFLSIKLKLKVVFCSFNMRIEYKYCYGLRFTAGVKGPAFYWFRGLDSRTFLGLLRLKNVTSENVISFWLYVDRLFRYNCFFIVNLTIKKRRWPLALSSLIN